MRHPGLRLVAIALLLAGCYAPPAASPATPGASAASATAVASASPMAETPEPTTIASEPASPLAWAEIATDGPSAREDHTWTVAAGGDVAFLFGGRDGGTAFGDLWAYRLADDRWTELTPGGGPPARFGHEAVWAEDIGRLVIFAGQAGSTFFNDLWAYDPATDAWSQMPAEGERPVARYGTCATVGPDGRLWISHGFTSDGRRFSDTWAYDFDAERWTDETPADGGRPVERCLHACWWNDAGNLVLYAGQTTGTVALDDRWILADGAWTEADGSLPPARNLYARVRLDAATLVFGGQALDQGYLGDLWLLTDDAADAAPLEVEAGPSARSGAELILDERRSRVLLFGGRDATTAHADVWQLSGGPVDGG